MSKECPLCGRACKGNEGLSRHLNRSHDKTFEWYYNNHEPKYCEYCEEQIPYTTGISRRKFCSRACAGKAHTGVRGRYGKTHVLWNGGRSKGQKGYVRVSEHLFSEEERKLLKPMFFDQKGSGYVPEHRAVVALAWGRPLKTNEVVHHRNGIRDDNRLENLEVWISGHPRGFSSNMSMCCPECGHEDTARYFFESYETE